MCIVVYQERVPKIINTNDPKGPFKWELDPGGCLENSVTKVTLNKPCKGVDGCQAGFPEKNPLHNT